MEKSRLDQMLVKKGLVESREKGKALIMAGKVFVNNERVDKSGTLVKDEDCLEIKGNNLPFVSRGGLKLEKALRVFSIEIKEKMALDVGASTGGFTDCLLQGGAKKVYAVDVGYGQLHWSLRNDSRVVNMERTNARNLQTGDIPEMIDLVTIDVAFISLEKILPHVLPFLKKDGQIVALIKPQFEAGREKVGKKGVVREAGVHEEVINKIIDFSSSLGLLPVGLDYSPVKGPEGNIEYLLWLKRNVPEEDGVGEGIDIVSIVSRTVEEAQRSL